MADINYKELQNVNSDMKKKLKNLLITSGLQLVII